ncbi:MAG: DNA-binding protein WhiA [Tissierellia bacterium]|nr:DNA-binding protein WhiA [Tissierellia bacterium]
MSFSNDIKTEISKHKISSKIEGLIELSAILKTNASISIRNAFFNINFSTENQEVSKRIYKLINKVYDYEPVVSFMKNDNIQKDGIYAITIDDEKVVDALLSNTGIDFYGNYTINPDILFQRLADDKGNKYASYLKGAFLGAGSMVEPSKSYHLEMIFTKLEDYDFTKKILDTLGVKPLLNIRKDKFVLYYKDSEKISDFLNIIGATNSMLELENVKAMKDLRNQVNRQVNCDTANINKTLETANKQREQIEYIEKNIGLSNLPEQLKELAYRRLENPELSLKDIGQLMDPPISKSGVSHRMNKIKDIYEDLIKKLGNA